MFSRISLYMFTGSCTVRWENKTMYCIVSVFGLAIWHFTDETFNLNVWQYVSLSAHCNQNKLNVCNYYGSINVDIIYCTARADRILANFDLFLVLFWLRGIVLWRGHSCHWWSFWRIDCTGWNQWFVRHLPALTSESNQTAVLNLFTWCGSFSNNNAGWCSVLLPCT